MTTQDLAETSLIYKVIVGSCAYGTNLPTSDKDYAGVYIPPLENYFGMNAFDHLNEQKEDDKNYYSLRKFAKLAVANNPSVLELLFVDDNDILLYDPSFQLIKENRDLFLSQRCLNSYMGYAGAQLHRIRNHRKWISQEHAALNILWPKVVDGTITRSWIQWRFGSNLVELLDRSVNNISSCYGNPDGSSFRDKVIKLWNTEKTEVNPELNNILKQLEGTGLIHPLELDARFYHEKTLDDGRVTLVYDEHKYKEEKKKRGQYTTWMAERDPSRHETEVKFGYDTKHAMHLVRLLRTGYEVLTEGKLLVKRPDAAELLDIRNGKWSYDQLTSYADEMLNKVNALKDFAVPKEPDFKHIDKLVVATTCDKFDIREVWN